MRAWFDNNWPFVCFIALALLCLFSIAMIPEPARDDTDPPDGRSGMLLLTDHKTGCQYLYRGSLTPRMDEHGKQICQ